MPSVMEHMIQTLALEHFTTAKTLTEETQAATPLDPWQLFEAARQAYQQRRDYPALVRLAQAQLAQASTAQERAACLLVAGSAQFHLRQYREARSQSLQPAVRLAGVAPETRTYLWHYLGLCALTVHDFPAATEAFRHVAELALGLHINGPPTTLARPPAPWEQLRNAALFYQGVIHLIHHRPRQTLQVLQTIQRPATAIDRLKTALYCACAYRYLHDPDAAEQALHPLARTPLLPEPLHAPVALVRAGIANLRGATPAVGTHLETALQAPLSPHTSWEPSWRTVLYQEWGLAWQRVGSRHAAIACYEESLKIAVYRLGGWQDTALRQWLRGASLYIALDNMPLHTWSALVRNEMIRSLQALAWLYGSTSASPLAATVLTLALRLAVTPEQRCALWLQRGWLAATQRAPVPPGKARLHPESAEVLVGVQQARSQAAGTPLAPALRGVEALLLGDTQRAEACFTSMPDVTEVPSAHAICVAAWLWAQGRQGNLDRALRQVPPNTPAPWQTEMILALALEMLFAWVASTASAPETAAAGWLEPLLRHYGPQSLTALRMLSQPAYLPEPQRSALLAALLALLTPTASHPLADAVAELLGGQVLLDHIEAQLARIDRQPPVPPPAPRQTSRRSQHRRRILATERLTSETSRLCQLLRRLHDVPQVAQERNLPEVICGWVHRYPQLTRHAPEVMGAVLDLLRHCPRAESAIRGLLHQVPLSKRQRQALEATLQNAPSGAEPTASPLAWESIRCSSLAEILATLANTAQPSLASPDSTTAAFTWYAHAVALARLGMLSHAADCVNTCLRLHPAQPLAHLLAAQLHRLLQQHSTALHHALQAWQALRTVSPQVIHLEVINQMLVLLGAQQRYERFPEWLTAFARLQAALQTDRLSPLQQQYLREEVAAYALAQVLYLSTTATAGEETDTVNIQLDLLAQAIENGTPSTRHVALHRQADILTRCQRRQEARATYTGLLQQWPNDRRARVRLALLTAMDHATDDVATADHALTEALTLAMSDIGERDKPAPLTPTTALTWLQHASANDAHMDDVSDVLTTYGGIAVQRQELTRALSLLEPLYAMQRQPRQAYYLAEAYFLQSQRAPKAIDRLQGCEQAMIHVRHALESASQQQHAAALLQQVQAAHASLTAARQHTTAFDAYRQRVCDLFTHSHVPFQEEMGMDDEDAPWLTMQEWFDLDETSGNPVVTIQLRFNGHATTRAPQPSEQEVRRYIQHQQDAHRVVETYGITALSWPSIAYTGQTAFALLFPARLGLNRDLLFVAYAAPLALLRYAHVLAQAMYHLSPLLTPPSQPSAPLLATAGRYVAVVPVLQQRQQTLAATTPSKALQRQLRAWETQLLPAWATRGHTSSAFCDALHYFTAITAAFRPVLTASDQSASGWR